MKTKKLIVCIMVIALSMPAYSVVIIGDWESGNGNGWINWGNNQSVNNMPSIYQYESNIGVTNGGSSLHLIKSGWNQTLSIKLQNNGLVDEFMANKKFLIDITIPADSFFDGSGGYAQVYNVSLNAQGYGWHDMFSPSPALNFYFWNGSPLRTATLEMDYSATKALMPAMPSYVEIIITTNSSSNRGNFYFDNARLVPEPATIGTLVFGALSLVIRRKR
jgi:hypothetical protein